MNWQDLAGPVIRLGGTAIGTMLGMPGLGAAGGQILATTLGVEPTPEAVGKALAEPGAANAVRAADPEATVALAQAAAQQSAEINATIRNEHGVSWYHWRHLIGYVTGGWAAGVAVVTTRLLWRLDAIEITAAIPLLTSMWAFFAALCALNGYVAMDTTRRKATALGQEIPSIVGSLLKMLKK